MCVFSYRTKRIGIFVLALLCQDAFSQAIYSATEFKKGIYRSFIEFVSNNPTVPFDEEKMEFVEEGQKQLVDDITGGPFILHGTQIKLSIYKLRYKGTKKAVNTKSFWGYCDGSKVFINSYTHIPKHYFVEVILIGRYCYFIQAGTVSDIQRANTLTTPFNELKDVEEYIINLNNGKIFNLDETLLKTILESDKELLDELNADRRAKRKLLLDYIRKYNERHVDEIKMSR